MTDLRWTRQHGYREFVNLSTEQEEAFLCELGDIAPGTRKDALSVIAYTLENYQRSVMHKKLLGAPSNEIHHAQAAAKAFSSAASAARNLGPELGEWLGGLGTVVGPEDFTLDELIPMLEEWSVIFQEEADTFVVAKGRPEDVGLQEAIIELGFMYKQATGKNPGISSQPEKKPTAGGQLTYGPFVRLCENVLSTVTPSESSTIHNAVRVVMRRVKKGDLQWPVIPPEAT